MAGFESLILIVDDERMVRESLVAYLEDEGFAVCGVASAEEALTFMEERPLALAVVDLRLPGMSGSELVVQGLKKSPCTRFLIHTGSANFNLSAELTALGLTDADVFRKPVLCLETMVHRIKECIAVREMEPR